MSGARFMPWGMLIAAAALTGCRGPESTASTGSIDATGAALSTPMAAVCDPRLTALFTPPRPQLGRYEVCATTQPIRDVADAGWSIEQVGPLDVLGAAGLYDRETVARLYGGRRAAVARGWIRQPGSLVAITLISPHPDATLSTLDEGTLVIRYYVPE